MPYLYDGVQKYRETVYLDKKKLLTNLKNGQTPKSLLITCSDSRISVNEFTHTDPGEVFTIRNAGNNIAPFDLNNATNEALTLEYGVQVLGVKEIIVCGHTQCGAMQGLMDLESLRGVPLVYSGIKRISSQFDMLKLKEMSLDDVIVENVKRQMLNLYSYPFVKAKIEAKELEVWGWVYDFGKGDIPIKISLREIFPERSV